MLSGTVLLKSQQKIKYWFETVNVNSSRKQGG